MCDFHRVSNMTTVRLEPSVHKTASDFITAVLNVGNLTIFMGSTVQSTESYCNNQATYLKVQHMEITLSFELCRYISDHFLQLFLLVCKHFLVQ